MRSRHGRSPFTGNNPSFEIEKELFRQGCRFIAGVDEAGRGALAGPLCVGLVIFDDRFFNDPPGDLLAINDSKKLAPRVRAFLRNVIRQHALISRTVMVSPGIVDRLNVNGATEHALELLLHRLEPRPEAVIMDGNFRFNPGIRFIPVTRGDSISTTIAAASIAAKVDRDGEMVKLNLRFPGYLLAKNKGYGTREHLDEIKSRGPSPIHRRSFEPVKSMLEQSGPFSHED